MEKIEIEITIDKSLIDKLETLEVRRDYHGDYYVVDRNDPVVAGCDLFVNMYILFWTLPIAILGILGFIAYLRSFF